MGALEKAKLQEVSADTTERAIGDPVPVQFNPSSLKLKLTNQMEGGRSTARVRRQQSGAGKTVLSMELVFDTADEGSDQSPVSVRTKTAIVERYVVPNSANSQTPPRLRFEWNDLVVSGIVESLDIDFDLFAANGTPLRAKVSLSIKEQEPKYQLRGSDQATPPGGGEGDAGGNNNQANGAGGNNGGAGGSDRSAPALDGETPAEFAARNGLDPSAWRGLDVDLSAGLSLSAGVEIGFSAGLSVSAGIGITAGVKAGVDLSLEASLGLSAGAFFSAGTRASTSSSASAGVALSAAGGVNAAIETAKIAKSDTAAEQARTNFALGEGSDATTSLSTSANPVAAVKKVQAGQEQAHTPLSVTGSRSLSQQQSTEPAPSMPRADARANSFGFGVPLRPLYPTAVEQQQPRLGAPAVSGGPPLSDDPSTAPWLALPRSSTQRTRIDELQAEKERCPRSSYPRRFGGKR